MINQYYRPKNMEDTLNLLAQPGTLPIGGGTWLNQSSSDEFSVVDLQSLNLTSIKISGNILDMDACVTLQQLYEFSDSPEAIKTAIRNEAGLNIRNIATIAGTLVTCTGRSMLGTTLLALDGKIKITNPQSEKISGLVEFFENRSTGLITQISIPNNVKLVRESVSRTPQDKPVVCVAAARWPGGRIRVAVGGFGSSPTLAMDGTEMDGMEFAAQNACYDAEDEWASGAYRKEIAGILAKRCQLALL